MRSADAHDLRGALRTLTASAPLRLSFLSCFFSLFSPVEKREKKMKD
jgi:hypothetical protein